MKKAMTKVWQRNPNEVDRHTQASSFVMINEDIIFEEVFPSDHAL
jgi:hypothetical protein